MARYWLEMSIVSAMLFLVTIQIAFLMAASVLLMMEVRVGSIDASSQKHSLYRATVYLLATIGGATLLITLADGERLFALALVPITFLSLLRFSMLARKWWEGWRLPVYTCALIALGIVLMLPMMPYPLNRTYVLEQLNLIDSELGRPDTIDPEAVRPVRV